jgi:hypothetical protein
MIDTLDKLKIRWREKETDLRQTVGLLNIELTFLSQKFPMKRALLHFLPRRLQELASLKTLLLHVTKKVSLIIILRTTPKVFPRLRGRLGL